MGAKNLNISQSKLFFIFGVALTVLFVLTIWNFRQGEVIVIIKENHPQKTDAAGGLELNVPKPRAKRVKTTSEPSSIPQIDANAKEVFSVADKGFWNGLTAAHHHVYDPELANALLKFFKSVNAASILELGAGMGNYAQLFKTAGIFTSCFDGNPKTQELSNGRCSVLDLSQLIDLSRHEWVLSLEVGEHIPKQFERNFISNLDKGNSKGLVLSWSVEGQGGLSHVNNRNNTYIKDKFERLGYKSDLETEKILRAAATKGWFKNTVMVFRK